MPGSPKADSPLAHLSRVTTPSVPVQAPFVERRMLLRREALRNRVRDEFLEMPGTALTIPQAARLFGLPREICARLFSELVRDGQLTLSTDSRYRLHSAA